MNTKLHKVLRWFSAGWLVLLLVLGLIVAVTATLCLYLVGYASDWLAQHLPKLAKTAYRASDWVYGKASTWTEKAVNAIEKLRL